MDTSPERERKQSEALTLIAEQAQGRPPSHAAYHRKGKQELVGLVESLAERLARIEQIAKAGLGKPDTGPATAQAERERFVRATQAPEMERYRTEQSPGRAEVDTSAAEYLAHDDRTKTQGYNHVPHYPRQPDRQHQVEEARRGMPTRATQPDDEYEG
jgi:hypothetical protein